MFLTAVLQAHTDRVSESSSDQAAPASPTTDYTPTLPQGLEAALATPKHERVQPLPAAHRARWV
jgi:hypothetical protein